jgi:hypothetical protein
MNSTMTNLVVPPQSLRKAVAIGFGCAALLMFASQAQATSFTNGSFETNTGAGQLGIGGGTTAAGWSVPSGGYVFLFAPGTADTTGAYTPEFNANLSLWGPNNGSANGLPASSPDGGYFIGMDSDFQSQPLQQTITGLTVGQTYQVGFWWAAAQQYGFNGETQENWTVSLGSESDTTATINLPSHGFNNWQYQTYDFTADSTSDVLSFIAGGSPGGPPPFSLLDGVSFSPVPEPGTLPLIFTGLMGGLTVLRSKKWRKS